MSTAVTTAVIEGFLKRDVPQVLALRGPWGVGKTHIWNDLLKKNWKDTRPTNYSYVSLFGLQTMADVRMAVAAQTVPVSTMAESRVGNKKTSQAIGEFWHKNVKRWIPELARSAPKWGPISVPFDKIANMLIAETLVCLDDFERTGLSADELLGFISSLKEERDCKVVLIFNQSKLGAAADESYKRYREKVVDLDVELIRTAQEAVEIALPKEMYARGLVVDKAATLRLTNIRVLRKVAAMVELVRPLLDRISEPVRDAVVASLVLMVWVHYAEDCSDKPAIEFLRHWDGRGPKRQGLRGVEVADADAPEVRWITLLHAYGYLYTDELDLALDQVVCNGYVEGSSLADEISQRDAKQQRLARRQPFQAAWDLYHGTFSDNEQQVIPAFSDGVRLAVAELSPMDLNATVQVLRQLDCDAQANELIDFYINSRRGDARLFDLESNPFGSEINDPTLRERFGRVQAAGEQRPSLYDAIVQSAERKSWSSEESEVMKSATDEDFFRELTGNEGEAFARFLRAAQWQATIQGHETIKQAFMGALMRVGSLSRINRARIRRFGLVIPNVVPAEAAQAENPVAEQARNQ